MIEIHAKADAKVEYVFCKTADDVEYQLIQAAHKAANAGNWIIGECASRWHHQYGKSKPSGWFAEQIDLSEEKVWQCRRVWERFGKVYDSFKHLTWSHFREACGWEDAHECLEWAEDCQATVGEMRAWHRAQNGQDLFAPADPCETEEQSRQRILPPKENTPSPVEGSNDRSSRRAPQPEKRNAAETSSPGDKPAESGKAETVSGAGAKTHASEGSNVATQESDSSSVQPAEVKLDSQTVGSVIERIGSLIGFVLNNGSESERQALLEKLRPVVDGLDPKHTTSRKHGQVAASLAIANVVVNEWNMIDGVIMCRAVTPKRRQAIQARMKDQFWKENWREAMDKIRTLPAMHGRNDRNWRADLDWFLRPDTVALVIEGKYDNWTTGAKTAPERRLKGNRNAFAEVFGEEERATIDDAVF